MSRFLLILHVLFLLCYFTSAALPPPANVSKFSFKVPEAVPASSAGIYDLAGHLVRQLWAMKPLEMGLQNGEWDGLDEFGLPAPAGDYEFRVVLNDASYRNVGIMGNTGSPANEMQHIQHGVASVAVDAKGNIYTANGWEEAGHDFKVMDPTGKTIFHARYQIRNGNPNGAPYSIAVDDGYIYCGMGGWASEQWKSKQQIQRFTIANGTLEKFTGLTENEGHIQLYEWPEKQVPEGTPEVDAAMMRAPIRSLAINGDTIYSADALGGKIWKFNKVTGVTLGSFPVALPHAVVFDSKGRLWIGHEHKNVSIYSANGEKLATPISDIGEIRALAFAPDGKLYVADGKAAQVKIYDVNDTTVKLARTFGEPAKPGDYAADHFYNLTGVAVDGGGNIVITQTVPTGGARIARFAPDGTCLWEQMALVFCDVGKYSPRNPDEFITHRLHRLAMTDKETGQWAYRGTILDGEAKYIEWQHGVLGMPKLGGNEFIIQCYGDGVQVYRFYDKVLKLVTMVGGRNPRPDGTYDDKVPTDKRQPLGQWTWTDSNGNNKVEDDEVIWFKQPGKGQYAVFGINSDEKGNLIYCEHNTGAIWELPISGLDAKGNPVYDWRLAHQITQRDTSPVKFFPLMALRAEDGTIYSFGRSEGWAQPKNMGAWMGGWALVRYDSLGKMIWAAKLPEVCVGMDLIPGGKGVMLGWYEKAVIYHYTEDGLLIGSMKPGDAAGNTTGWMDNTSAVAVARDPRDNKLDVFGEDSWLNRLIWYRVDDKNIQLLKGKITRK